MPYLFRFHHLFCTLGFQGKGYSPKFVQNYTQIKESLNDNSLIKLTSKTDDICAPCPNRLGELCNKQEKIETLDQAHAKALHFKEGETLTWGEAKKRLSTLTLQDHQEICQGCSWLDYGLCAEALKHLKSTP